MRKFFIKVIFIFVMLFTSIEQVIAYNYNVLVLPTDIVNICDNYYCFPEVSNILAQDIIKNLNQKEGMNAKDLYEIRKKLNSDDNLRRIVLNTLNQYQTTDKIDFNSLQKISSSFGVKSVLLINAYVNNDKSKDIRRNLWEVFEIGSTFNIYYPQTLNISAVLTDSVNNVVMWSSKYKKTVSNSDDYFGAKNQTQAISQLEKIKQYLRTNVSKNISQNIYLRFFPKDTLSSDIDIKSNTTEKPQFMPNALEKLSPYSILKDLEKEKPNNYDNPNDFIFQF